MTIETGDAARRERFKALYQKHYRRMVKFYVRAFRFAEEDAEELAQEAFMRFYEAMEEYRGEAEWAFLETIARNVAYNKLRAAKTQKRNVKTVDIDDPDAVGVEPAAAAEPDYAERQESERRRKELYQALDALPPRQRQVMLLWLQGFTYEEIARALRVTVDAVKSSVRDAKKALRARLGDDGMLPEDER